ncbi:NYN domain-containing protein [Nocardioides sp.]|uniref:NYN domain-containing protein n=1 Tax=Nocardioides sp. TaxID=35761 RepID=UPI00356B4C20
MPPTDNLRLAVLIDADNTSPKHAAALMEEVAKYGIPTVKRAYGDWTTPHLGGWRAKLAEHAIQSMLQVAYTTGKNSTDSALIIDAMDLLYSNNLDAFAIVSSDSDFTRLAMRLRESGKTVYGFGLRKTPKALVNACNRFIFLEVLGSTGGGDEPEPHATAAAEDEDESAPLPDLREILTSAIDDTSQEDGWAHLGQVGSVLGTRYATFDPRNYGFPKLIALVRAQDYLDVEQNEGAPRVRLAPKKPKVTTRRRPAKKTAAKKADGKASTQTSAQKTGQKSGQPAGE